jgi:hypothetical protein
VANCFNCTVVGGSSALPGGPQDPVAICSACSVLGCSGHGGRVVRRARFFCVLCFPRVLSHSGGLGGPPPGGGGGGGGGGGPTATPAPRVPDDGGDAVAFHSRAEFVEQHSDIARASADARAEWDWAIPDVLDRLERFDRSRDERERVAGAVTDMTLTAQAEAVDRAISETLATGDRVAAELRSAHSTGRLDPQLLADSFGVATWAIGLELGAIPSPAQVGLLGGAHVRFVVGFFVPVAATASAGA